MAVRPPRCIMSKRGRSKGPDTVLMSTEVDLGKMGRFKSLE